MSDQSAGAIRRWHPRVLAKLLLSKVTLVPNYCKRCGREAEPFQVPDEVWNDIYGGNGRNERCLRCFAKEARKHAGKGDTVIDTLGDYTIAPQHSMGLAELDPYIIEGVAYSPLKMTFLSSSYDEDLELRCDSCEWTTTVGELPENSGYVQPDMCPDCAKDGEMGFVRCESPADGTFPSGWNR